MLNRCLRLLASSGLVLAGLTLAGSSARAAFVTVSASQTGSAQAGLNYSTFDSQTLGSTNQTTSSGLQVAFSGTGGGAFVNGTVPNQYVAPTFAAGNNTNFYPSGSAPAPGIDTTNYISTGSGAVTFTSTSGTLGTYFGLLWGTVDSYNSLTFNFSDGTTQTVTGTQLPGIPFNANVSAFTSFVVVGSATITSVVAFSGINSFEIDNVAYGVAVPEPSSMALCGIAGAIGLGVARRRARRAIA